MLYSKTQKYAERSQKQYTNVTNTLVPQHTGTSIQPHNYVTKISVKKTENAALWQNHNKI